MAAFEMPVLVDTLTVTSDLSGSQFLLLKEDGTLAGVAEVATGVLQNKPEGSASSPRAASIMRQGISRAIASAAIAKGVKVAPAAGGKLRTAVTGDHVVGVSLETAAADGDIIPLALAFGGAPLA